MNMFAYARGNEWHTGTARKRVPAVGFGLVALLLVSGLGTGCAPMVAIDSTRNATVSETIEPVAFVIFEGNTGPRYTEPLQKYLTTELARHDIPGRVEIITGSEFDEEGALRRAYDGMSGLVRVVPVGGTSYYGSLTQIRYDVQAFRIDDPESGEGIKVWRGNMNTASGAYGYQIEDRSEAIAQNLVSQLVAENVLPSAIGVDTPVEP